MRSENAIPRQPSIPRSPTDTSAATCGVLPPHHSVNIPAHAISKYGRHSMDPTPPEREAKHHDQIRPHARERFCCQSSESSISKKPRGVSKASTPGGIQIALPEIRAAETLRRQRALSIFPAARHLPAERPPSTHDRFGVTAFRQRLKQPESFPRTKFSFLGLPRQVSKQFPLFYR